MGTEWEEAGPSWTICVQGLTILPLSYFWTTFRSGQKSGASRAHAANKPNLTDT